GRANPAGGFISPANKKWYNDKIRQYTYDPDKAKVLLAEIGIKDRDGDGILEDADGNKIEFVLNTNTGNSVREKIGVIVQADLKKLGVQLIFQPLDFNTLVNKLNTTYDYESSLLVFGGDSTDPSNNMNMLRSEGFTHTWFPRQKAPSTDWEARIDWLMNAQLKTLDYTKRKEYFDEVQAIMEEQAPMISLVSSYAFASIRSDIGNARPTALHSLRLVWNIEELYFKKK